MNHKRQSPDDPALEPFRALARNPKGKNILQPDRWKAFWRAKIENPADWEKFWKDYDRAVEAPQADKD